MSREGDYYKCIKRRSVVCRGKANTEIAFVRFEHCEKVTTETAFAQFEHCQSDCQPARAE